jgi:two-component system, NtrC family, sensor histidine kinase HydH
MRGGQVVSPLAGFAAGFRRNVPRRSIFSRGVAPFNLLRWFSVLSFLCIVLLSATLATVLSRFMTGAMVKRDAAISAQFIESFALARPDWDFKESEITQPDPALISLSQSFFGLFHIESDVVRTNIYARDRTVIWSNTHALIGTRLGPNEQLEEALKGQIATELGTIGVDDEVEHVEFEPELTGERYVESYIPIWSRDRKTVVGVVEIYRLAEDLFQAIDVGRWLIWISTLAGGALLYIILFGIVRKASVIIEEQEKKLIETESMATIGEMASAVAHGIRNPLASIRSSAELAMIRDADHARTAMQDIVLSVDRLSDWIRTFLYQAHSHGSTSATSDLNAIARSGLAGFAASMQRQGVDLMLNVREPLPLVHGDPVVLGHALNSLFANALEAMPQGGKLQITTCLSRSGQEVEVQIVDSGPGIVEHLVRPFVTSKHGGLGLGLALSRRIIKRLGGTLDLRGNHGAGSVATVRIPVAN